MFTCSIQYFERGAKNINYFRSIFPIFLFDDFLISSIISLKIISSDSDFLSYVYLPLNSEFTAHFGRLSKCLKRSLSFWLVLFLLSPFNDYVRLIQILSSNSWCNLLLMKQRLFVRNVSTNNSSTVKNHSTHIISYVCLSNCCRGLLWTWRKHIPEFFGIFLTHKPLESCHCLSNHFISQTRADSKLRWLTLVWRI